MKLNLTHWRLGLIYFNIIFLVGCAQETLSSATPAPILTTPAATNASKTESTPIQTLTLPEQTPIIPLSAHDEAHRPTSTHIIPPTPDTRLRPEYWREWPVVPEISPRAFEIYQRGLALGKNSHAFSKIGDCQSVPASFLGIYDTGRYFFTPEYQYLQESIEYFSGSFNREGESVRGGFNAAAVLLPFWANSAVCQPGETPIACENRIHQPSIVFISLEVWFEGRTPEVYEKYLRRIIDYNLEQGTLPILATKADNVEGDHSINYTIAKLAYEYDLPLWNFWRAVQPLPNHGLDPQDEGKFHLSVDGWNMRSFSALQVLDAVRRAVTNTSKAQTQAVSTATPEPTAAPTLSFQPQAIETLPHVRLENRQGAVTTPVPQILFSLSFYDGQKQQSAGVFSGTLNAQGWQKLAGGETRLLDASSNGVLLAQARHLYLFKDTTTRLLSNILAAESPNPAVWLANGQVIALLRTNEAVQVAIIDPSDGNLRILPPTERPPYQLYRSPNTQTIYWSAGPCSPTACRAETLFASPIDSGEAQSLPYEGQPAFGPDGKMAFLNRNEEGKNQVTLVDGLKTYNIQTPGNRLVSAAWSPDGKNLAVNIAQVSDYSGRIVYSWLYFIRPPALLDGVLAVSDEAIESLVWAPDGTSILVVRRSTKGPYLLKFSVFDAQYQYEKKTPRFNLSSEEFALPAPIFWIH